MVREESREEEQEDTLEISARNHKKPVLAFSEVEDGKDRNK